MADPCTRDSTTVHVDSEGTPAVLFAEVLELAQTYSATQGDNTPHIVTDTEVEHVQTRTVVIPNPFADHDVRGIIVVAFSPIIIDTSFTLTATQYNYDASLTVDTVVQDSYTQELDVDDSGQPNTEGQIALPIPSLLGQLDIAAGGSSTVIFQKRIMNGGPSIEWSFLMNGDKLVANYGP